MTDEAELEKQIQKGLTQTKDKENNHVKGQISMHVVRNMNGQIHAGNLSKITSEGILHEGIS